MNIICCVGSLRHVRVILIRQQVVSSPSEVPEVVFFKHLIVATHSLEAQK